MAKEHWLKVLDITEAEVQRLIEANFVPQETVLIEDVYFSHRWWDLRGAGYQFRLRWARHQDSREYVELVFKTPPNELNQRKTKSGRLWILMYFEAAIFFWRLLGFTVHTRRQKIRRRLADNLVEIQIDQYPGIPAYAEITGPQALCELIITFLLNDDRRRITRDTASKVFARYGIYDSTRVLFPKHEIPPWAS